jgi:hypothetical protein
MIGGSTFLAEEVAKYLKNPAYAEQWIGFPDAAVAQLEQKVDLHVFVMEQSDQPPHQENQSIVQHKLGFSNIWPLLLLKRFHYKNMKIHFLFKLSLFVNGSLMIPTEKPKRFS